MTHADAERNLPGTYVREFVDLCGRFGVEPQEILRGSGLRHDALADPASRVPLDVLLRIVRRAIKLTGEPGIAFYMGLHMRISWHGFLGFAAMTAPTIREALRLAERFATTKTAAIALSLHEEGDRAYVHVEERAPLEPELHELIVIALFSGLKQIGEALTGAPMKADIDLAFPEPAYSARFHHFVPGRARFNQPMSRIILERSFLDVPLVSSDPVAMQLARDQCERELAALGPGSGIVEQVRKLVRPKGGVVLGIAEVARRLHVSTRTLKRRLAERGVTFTEVVHDVRHKEALVLLADARLPIDEIASGLGYSDTTNFTRAFRRWTGTTPGAWRGQKRGSGA
jgi:AraC-like DNA-binding protein